MDAHAKTVQLLTNEDWDRRKRNAVAKQFALGRNDGDDDVIRTSYHITNHELMGRYDRLRAQLLRVVAEAGGCAAHIKSQPRLYQGKRRTYRVILFGYRSDVQRSIGIYEKLMEIAAQKLLEVPGQGGARRRRVWLDNFLLTLRERLTEVGAAPSMTWMSDHYARAKAALDESPARWDRELV